MYCIEFDYQLIVAYQYEFTDIHQTEPIAEKIRVPKKMQTDIFLT